MKIFHSIVLAYIEVGFSLPNSCQILFMSSISYIITDSTGENLMITFFLSKIYPEIWDLKCMLTCILSLLL
jgi:hypothetical protein